ncbi:MAG TPA: hypothetical protein VFU43_05650 [Streptosporangiaceae bacterium]|nr:hypothetical protein [Streptosporangiaceae bacterium]
MSDEGEREAGIADRPAEPSTEQMKPSEHTGRTEPPTGAESVAGSTPAPRTGWEGALFDGDHGPGVPGYAPVEPSGPRTPPKPGTPSSGNLRLPEWMRAEMSGETPGEMAGEADAGRRGHRSDRRPGADYDEEDEGRTRLMLFFGVGLLVVALLAAGAVYVLKKSSGGADEAGDPAAGAAGATPSATVRPPDVALPPNKPLARFRGVPHRAAGVLPDRHAGVAYPRLAAPWQIPGPKSGLGRLGWSGQQVLVTERGGGGRPTWYGQLLSGTLSDVQRPLYAGPGTERQAAVALAAQYEARFYPFPHKTRSLASQPLTVDGHRGWLVASYVGYRRPGVKATAEVVAVALVNTGRPSPAVLYMAIPNTNRDRWPDFNYVFTSLRLAR